MPTASRSPCTGQNSMIFWTTPDIALHTAGPLKGQLKSECSEPAMLRNMTLKGPCHNQQRYESVEWKPVFCRSAWMSQNRQNREQKAHYDRDSIRASTVCLISLRLFCHRDAFLIHQSTNVIFAPGDTMGCRSSLAC